MSRFNFFKADYVSIHKYLDSLNWESLLGERSVDEMVDVFSDILRDVMQKFVPKCKLKSTKYPVWYSTSLIRMLKIKNRIRYRYKMYKNPLDEIEFKYMRDSCKKMAKECYDNYIKSVESNIKDNVKSFWSFIKEKRGNTSAYPATMSNGIIESANGAEVTNMFASHFAAIYSEHDCNVEAPSGSRSGPVYPPETPNTNHLTTIVVENEVLLEKLKRLDITKGAGPDEIPPYFIASCASCLVTPLCLIYNKSLSSGKFPSKWKEAKVVPIHKSGDSTLISNYRPVSILSTLAKILESLVYPYIQCHFKQFLDEHQHGFVGARSTSTNLTLFVETLSEAVDNNMQADVIYTDFSKAFDRVSHAILLQKMSKYGFAGALLNWIESYLSNRSYHVVLNGFKSTTYAITSGVPQGSHLGPILFNIFINDVTSCFCSSIPFLFADDLKIVKTIKSDIDTIRLQADVDRLSVWCRENGMQLNPAKCQHIKFTRKRLIINSEYKIDGVELKEVDCIRDLGVIMDQKLTFKPHMDNIIKRASGMLGFVIRNTKLFRKPSTKILLYNSLVRSILEYCSTVWRPHYAVHSLRIERIQKRFMWHLSFSAGIYREKKSYLKRLKHFKMDSLDLRRKVLDLTFIHKLLNSKIDCPPLLTKIKFRVPGRYPRKPITLLSPPFRRTVLGSNSPIPRMCKLTNECSGTSDIFANSLPQFKKLVKLRLE